MGRNFRLNTALMFLLVLIGAFGVLYRPLTALTGIGGAEVWLWAVFAGGGTIFVGGTAFRGNRRLVIGSLVVGLVIGAGLVLLGT